MPFTNSLSFTQTANDNETGVVADLTDYAISGNPVRSAKANYLLWAKTDKNGVRTFDNPDPGNVLSNLSYTVNTPSDGHYEGILMRFDIYDGGTPYAEDEAVYHDGAVYIANGATTGNLPTDTNFWTMVTDLSTLIANASVEVYIEDFYNKARSLQCLNQILTNCNCCTDIIKSRAALAVKFKILAADLAFADDNPARMEKIMRDVESTCSTC